MVILIDQMAESPSIPDAPATPALTAPVAPGERYELIDIIRGFALFGVLMSNLSWMIWEGLTRNQRADLQLDGVDDGFEFFLNLFIEHKFYSLFSILFGLGFAVQLSRAAQRGRSVVPTYLRRVSILFVLGVVHLVFIWGGDILHLYALLGFVLILFRNRSDRSVLAWAIGIASVAIILPCIRWGLLMIGWDDVELFGGGMTAPERFAALMSGSWSGIIDVNISFIREDYGDVYGIVGWYLNVMSRFLFGLYIGRRMFLQRAEQHLGLFRGVLPWALTIGLAGNLISALALLLFRTWIPREESAVLLLWIPVEIGVIALALAYLCGLVLLYQKDRWKRVLAWLAPVGRMALTNYLMHSVFYVFLLHGVGLGLLGKLPLVASLGLAFAIFGFQIVLSAWWLKYFRFGPMEWVWRSLTYGAMQPLRVRTEG